MKTIYLTFFISLFLILEINAQAPSTTWGRILKAESADTFARIFAGAVHIGPSTDHPTNLTIDYASIPALEDVLLFVEEGIATENMTYIFEEDWDEWPDYVFDEAYKSLSLDDLETYIKENKHLPEVISQKEVKEKGVNDKQMSITLLKKIEELTLYTIEQHKALKTQKDINTSLLQKLNDLEDKVNSMSNINNTKL